MQIESIILESCLPIISQSNSFSANSLELQPILLKSDSEMVNAFDIPSTSSLTLLSFMTMPQLYFLINSEASPTSVDMIGFHMAVYSLNFVGAATVVAGCFGLGKIKTSHIE